MSCKFLVFLFLTLSFTNFLEANSVDRFSFVVITGTIYCDTCFQQDFSMATSHFISGATVAIECRAGKVGASFRRVTKTNRHGEFKFRVPLKISKHLRKIKGCRVEPISSGDPHCPVASTGGASSSLDLMSRKQGVHVFSVGVFRIKPLKQEEEICNGNPSPEAAMKITTERFVKPISKPENALTKASERLNMEDLFPPASPFPPILQPPPLLPPIPFQPSPPPFFNFPPIPGLTPPPPPALPFPLPPFPFLPPWPPLFPGTPPASSSLKTSAP